MDIRKTRTCEQCRTVVPLEKVRLFPQSKDKNLVVCETCCEELKATSRNQPSKLSSRIAPLPPAEYRTFLCNRCDYSFRVDKSKLGITYNLHCPYCGLNDRIQRG